MILEELKAEAKAQGYKLIKDNPMPKLLPCTCGCNRRDSWSRYDKARGISLMAYKCSRCSKKAPFEPSERAAREAWNRMILEEQDNG